MARPPLEETYRTYTETYQSYNGVGNGNYPFSLRDIYRTFGGQNTPNWPRVKQYNSLQVSRSALPRGGTRPLLTFYRYYLTPGSAWDKGSYVFRTGTYVIPTNGPDPFGLVSHDTGMRGRVIAKAMDQVQDRKVNFAQFIAERKQLENTMTQTVKRLTQAVHCVRRKDLRGLKEALGLTKQPNVKELSGNLSKDWLAFQYGWKPLLADVKGFAEHFAERELNRNVRIRVKARSKLPLPAASRLGQNGIFSKPVVDYYWDEGYTDGMTILEFTVTNDFKRTGTQLGLTDPLTLAWELLPYSFVVDWFLPIGSFLNRLNYDSGLTYRGGATTLFSFRKYRAVVRGGVYIQPDGQRIELSGGDAVAFESLRVDRENHSVAPGVVLPSFKDPFSPTHFMNALALFRVAFGGPASSWQRH